MSGAPYDACPMPSAGRGPPPVIVGCLADDGMRDDVARQLARVGAVEWLASASALLARVDAGGVDAVVTEPVDGTGHSVARVLVAMAAHRPPPAVALYGRVNAGTVPQLRAVLAPGLRARCVVRPHEPLAPALLQLLAGCPPPGVEPVLLHHVVPRASQPLRVFVALAALQTAQGRGLAQLARWSDVSARTIERRLRHAGWPSARRLMQAFAALDAAWLMTQYRWSAHRVHRVRGLPHATSVTRMLARYCGTRPRTLREDGGFAAALAHVLATLPSRR